MEIENHKIVLNQSWNKSRIFEIWFLVILLKRH